MNEILVIENDLQVKRLLTVILENHGFVVRLANDTLAGFKLASQLNPNLILYGYEYKDDIGLNNITLLKKWYKNGVFVLSEIDDEELIVKVFDLGVNDYIIKPFRTKELVARIKSYLGHHHIEVDNDNKQTSKLVFNDIEVDLYNTTIKKNGELIKLTKTEHYLLVLLSKNAGRVMSHSMILKEIWGIGSQTNTYRLRVVIGRLRKKIETNIKKPTHIITMNGMGIMFQ